MNTLNRASSENKGVFKDTAFHRIVVYGERIDPAANDIQINNANMNEKQCRHDDNGIGEELPKEFLCNFSLADCERFVKYYYDYNSRKL